MKKIVLSLALVLALLLGCGGSALASGLVVGSAAEPLVYTSPNVTCSVGDMASISVSASSTDGGFLSYQWYSSPDGSNLSGSLIYGATNSSYSPFTSQTGTTYYYCVVTNTSSMGSSSVISAVISVTVNDDTPTGMGVLTLPTKIQYKSGDTIDPSGLSVRVYTRSGGYYDVTAGLEVSPAVLDAPVDGYQTITVRYEGLSCTFQVQVEEDKEQIQMITVASRPDKFIYTAGERLDTSGLTLRVVTNKQTTEVTSGFTCSPLTLTTEGDQTITVLYQGVRTTFSVHVNAAASASPSPSPSPTATAAPSASPTATPIPSAAASALPTATASPSNDRGHSSSNTAIQIILMLALLGLVGLGAFVFYMRRKGAAGTGDSYEESYSRDYEDRDDDDRGSSYAPKDGPTGYERPQDYDSYRRPSDRD